LIKESCIVQILSLSSKNLLFVTNTTQNSLNRKSQVPDITHFFLNIMAWFSLETPVGIVLHFGARSRSPLESLMPPVDQAKTDALTLLLDEIELLSAQTRSLELSLQRAHTDALEEVAKFQQQFRAKATRLQAEFEDRGNSFSTDLTGFGSIENLPNLQNQDLLRRLAEQQNLITRAHEESERRGTAIVALREKVSRLEATNRGLEQSTALKIEQARQEMQSQVAQLQAELARKDENLQQLQIDLRQIQQSTHADIMRLEDELRSARQSGESRRLELEGAESERSELRRRLAAFESSREQAKSEAERELAAARHDVQAKIAALQSEITHKTALLVQNQSTIARLEEELKALAESLRAKEAETRRIADTQTADLARRDLELAELRAAAEQQRKAAADDVVRARETVSREIDALRSELKQKELLLEQRANAQNVEQELRNRYRELQGRLAAKESVIESQEYHLRNAQTQLLTTRDALGEKERALAEWQARLSEQERHFEDERKQWQCRLAETQLLAERYSVESEKAKTELAVAFEGHGKLAHEQSALREHAQQLSAQVEQLTRELHEKRTILDRQDESVRRSGARETELSVALAEAQDALAKEQARARNIEQSLTAELDALRLELQQNAETLRERYTAASRETGLTAEVDQLQMQLQERERLLEARAIEIGILQERVEGLSGQAARLEAAHQQALADAAAETDQTRQALQAEIAALRSTSDKQLALLEQRQAALNELEQTMRVEIDSLKQQSGAQQALLQTQSADLQHAVAEANALRERLAEVESAARDAEQIATRRYESDAQRNTALDLELESARQKLAESEAALQWAQQELQNARAGIHENNQAGREDQSAELRAAQEKIAELLDRLAQLEAARHTLQENAGHELQQLRESFETRIAKLRMELAAKEQARPQNTPAPDNEIALTGLQEVFKKQIHELHSQLAEQHTLLENRNEELIRVKGELDALQDRFTVRGNSAAPKSIHQTPSVELREEDAVEPPPPFVNGSSRPDALDRRATDTGPENRGTGSHRFTHLEGRVRAWNPQHEKDSAFGSGRRWNIGLFKRRWKA
jgi:chromosome segregation ATPase